MRIPPTANPRFPGPGSSSRGQAGPKARPKGVADGQQANIPAPRARANAETPPQGSAPDWKLGLATRRPPGRKAPSGRPRKAAVASERAGPYRKPTQVDGSSRPRCARETTLRNSAKLPRNFGIRGARAAREIGPARAAVERPRRLFSKNTALCEPARGCIGCDT